MKTYTDDDLIDYLVAQGISLIPIKNKRPYKKKAEEGEKKFTEMYNSDWVEYLHLHSLNEYADYLKVHSKKKDCGFSVVLHDDFLVIDFDPGHEQAGMLPPREQLSQLMKLLKHQRTLYAKKDGSMNLHLFYKSPVQSLNDIGFLKSLGISCDVFTVSRHTRIIPDYYFANLDFSKGFIEQMAYCPDFIKQYAEDKENKIIKQTEYLKKHSFRQVEDTDAGEWMAKKIDRWAYAGYFSLGSQNTSIFKFALSALRHGIPGVEVEQFLDSFTTECLPDMTVVVRQCVQSAQKYI